MNHRDIHSVFSSRFATCLAFVRFATCLATTNIRADAAVNHYLLEAPLETRVCVCVRTRVCVRHADDTSKQHNPPVLQRPTQANAPVCFGGAQGAHATHAGTAVVA